MNGKNPLSSATASPSQDGSPLTDMPVLTKLSAVQSDISSVQFKSPRLQQLLGNRSAAAGSVNISADGKPSDSRVPAENEGDASEVGDVRKSDSTNETVDIAEV